MRLALLLVGISIWHRLFANSFTEVSFDGDGYLVIQEKSNLESINVTFNFLTGALHSNIIYFQSTVAPLNRISISIQDGDITMLLNFNNISKSATISGVFNNGCWHRVEFIENNNRVIITVDGNHSSSAIVELEDSVKKFYFDYLLIGELIRNTKYRFRGCVGGLIMNGNDILNLVKHSMIISEMVQIGWSCPNNSFTSNWMIPISMESESSAITYSLRNPINSTIHIQFDFKSMSTNRTLFQLYTDDTYFKFDLFQFYLLLLYSNRSYRVPASPSLSQGHWNTININISKFFLNISINSKFVFSHSIDLEILNNLTVNIGSIKFYENMFSDTELSKSIIGCLRNVFIDHHPFSIVNATFTKLVVTGCSWTFGCIFSPCPINGYCTHLNSQFLTCHCQTNPCLPNIQTIDSKYSSLMNQGQMLSVYHKMTFQPSILLLAQNITDFLTNNNLNSLTIFQLPFYSTVSLVKSINGSLSNFRRVTHFTVHDLIQKRIFCCIILGNISSEHKSKQYYLQLMISLNTSGGQFYNYIPHSAFINGIYLQINITYSIDSHRPILKLPSGRIVISDYSSFAINPNIIQCEPRNNTFVVLTSFLTEILCGQFSLKYNHSYETTFHSKPIKIKCDHIHAGHLQFRSTKQCDYQIFAINNEYLSKKFIISFIPKLTSTIHIRNTGLSCALYSQTFILSSHLSVQIPKIKAAETIFRITNSSIKKSNIEIFNSKTQFWKKSTHFSQADVNRGFVRYVSQIDDEYSLHLTYIYIDLSIVVHTKLMKNIVLLVQLTKLEVQSINNWGLILNRQLKRFIILSDKYLNVIFRFESVSSEPLQNIRLSLKNVPKYGFLSFKDSGKKITGFSLLNLRSGKVIYALRNDTNNRDRIKESLELDILYKSVDILKSISFAVYIVYNEFPPDLILHKYPKLVNNQTNNYKINVDNLWLSSDHCYAFQFTIIESPKFGKIFPHINYFTKQDVIEGTVNYRLENFDYSEDRFIFHLTCKNEYYFIDVVDEFWLEFELRNNFPPEREYLEKFFINYRRSEILSPALIWFLDQDKESNIVYRKFCHDYSFPPCVCSSNSLQIYDLDQKKQASFTASELSNYKIKIQNFGLIEETVCFLISDGRFERLAITTVNVDNLSGLQMPPVQQLRIKVNQNWQSRLFVFVKFNYYRDLPLDDLYLVLISTPNFGYLSSISDKIFIPGDLISFHDILQLNIIYTLRNEFLFGGVKENIKFNLKSVTTNENTVMKINIITEITEHFPSNYSVLIDAVPVRLNKLIVLTSNDLTKITKNHLLSTSQLIKDKHQIVYHISKAPLHGSLQYRRNSFVMNKVERFSQFDIDSGWIYYNCKICGFQQFRPVEDEVGKMISDGDVDKLQNDDFIFRLETPLTSFYHRHWKFRVSFTNTMMIMMNDGLTLQSGTNCSLGDINITIYHSFYFLNNFLNFNLSFEEIIFKIHVNPILGNICSTRFQKSIHYFRYRDLKQNEIVYKHFGNSSSNEDYFEIMAYSKQGNSRLPIISDPMKIFVHINHAFAKLNLKSLYDIHTWPISKVAITNQYLESIFVNETLGNTSDIIYLVVSTIGGYISRLDQPALSQHFFTQRDIDFHLIYFIKTGNKNIKEFGGFRFHVTIKGNRNIPIIVGEELKIIFYPLKFSIYKSSTFQVSSISACQTLNENHLKTIFHRPNPSLPPVDIYYKIIRIPRYGTINKKVFNNLNKSTQLKAIYKNMFFSENDVKNKLICFIISPGLDFGSFHDVVDLAVNANSSFHRKSNFVTIDIFIAPENINLFNQEIFFHSLSWMVQENESLILTPDKFRFKEFVQQMLTNTLFQLLREPNRGYLFIGDTRAVKNSWFSLTNIARKQVFYSAAEINSFYPITENIGIQMLIGFNKTHRYYDNQNILLTFTVTPATRNILIDINCVKHSHAAISSVQIFNNTKVMEGCEKLLFKILMFPVHGRIIVKTNESDTTTTDVTNFFLCTEVIHNLVYYRNTNPHSDSDLVGIDLYHENMKSVLHHLTIKIKLIQFRMELVPKPVNILQCEDRVPIKSDQLILDTNIITENNNFDIFVDLPPLYGNICIDHVPVSAFTYSDVLQSHLFYIQSDMRRSNDRFEVSVHLNSFKQRIGRTVPIYINVVPRVKVKSAVVMIGAKLVITPQYINSGSLIQCSGSSLALFTVWNKHLKYGELSREKTSGDSTFTNLDISAGRIVYESFSFYQKEIDDFHHKNMRPVLVEEIIFGVSAPNSTSQVQPSFVTFRIQITSRRYADSLLLLQTAIQNSSLFLTLGNLGKQDDMPNNYSVRDHFTVPIICIILLSVVLAILAVLAIWYCARYHQMNRKHLFYHMLSSFPNSMKKINEPVISNIQCVDHAIPMFNNRLFIDSDNDNNQSIDQSTQIFNNRLFTNSSHDNIHIPGDSINGIRFPSTSFVTDLDEIDQEQESTVNTIKAWL